MLMTILSSCQRAERVWRSAIYHMNLLDYIIYDKYYK